MVLFLLVQHVLLLGLLQGSLIDLPPVQLPQLLTLLRGKQFIRTGCSQTHPVQGREQVHVCPKGSQQKEPGENSARERPPRPRGIYVLNVYTCTPCSA